MCGIVGAAVTSGVVEADVLQKAADCLTHRGPDDAGVHVSPRGNAGLAFRRLSIIDLSPSGHQPMLSEDGRLSIVFNGELYNFREMRAELEQKGRRFRSRSDTEVVLAAYAEWGERCLGRFVGMYGLAIWDESTQELFLARDRLGVKPLYYALERGGIRFGSEIKAIVTAGLEDRVLDAGALREYFSRGYISAPRTIFRAVRALPPAHALRWRAGVCSVSRYWDPLEHAEPRVRDAREAVEELDHLLRSAVRLQLVSDVPIGAFLSGGIDSSVVAALMRAESAGPVRTFSIGFADAGHDESAQAAAVARHLGTEHVSLMATEADALALVRSLPDVFDEPFADSSQLPTLLVSRLTRSHVTVALSGDGGDELFAGYEAYRRATELAPLWSLPQSLRQAAAPIAALGGNRGQRMATAMRAGGVLEYAESSWRIWPADDLAQLAPALASAREDDAFAYDSDRYRWRRSGSARDPVERMMLSDIERYLPGDLLAKVDRASMACGLEARVPLLDHRVAEFALGLPLDLKQRNGTSKFILKEVLARYVPRELVAARKQGFSVPLGAWLGGALRPLVTELLAPDRVAAYGLFDPAVVSAIANDGQYGRVAAERVWTLLMFQLWIERYARAGALTIEDQS